MLRGSIFFILGKRDDVRDAEGGILKNNLSEIKSGEGGDGVRDWAVIGF